MAYLFHQQRRHWDKQGKGKDRNDPHKNIKCFVNKTGEKWLIFEKLFAMEIIRPIYNKFPQKETYWGGKKWTEHM